MCHTLYPNIFSMCLIDLCALWTKKDCNKYKKVDLM